MTLLKYCLIVGSVLALSACHIHRGHGHHRPNIYVVPNYEHGGHHKKHYRKHHGHYHKHCGKHKHRHHRRDDD